MWLSYASSTLRLFIITPLILNKFTPEEISVWYLFASINFIGIILRNRLNGTFSNYFAQGLGGHDSFEPFDNKDFKTSSKEFVKENWIFIEKVYYTLSYLLKLLSLFNLIITSFIGLYSINNIVDGLSSDLHIWLSFSVFQITTAINIYFGKYSTTLNGLNYVALNNRWSIITNVASMIIGIIVLSLNYGILILTITVQLVLLLSLLRFRISLVRILKNKLSINIRNFIIDFKSIKIITKVASKGLMYQYSVYGVSQLTAILYTGIGTPTQVAELLLAFRIMEIISVISQAPISSKLPIFARYYASDDLKLLEKIFVKSLIYSLSIFALGILSSGIILPWYFNEFDSNIDFIPITYWLMYGFVHILLRFNIICIALITLGNKIVFHIDSFIGFIIGILIVYFLQEYITMYILISFIYLPMVIIFNIRPIKMAYKTLYE